MDQPADGVAPEQRALRPAQDFDRRGVVYGQQRTGGRGKIDPVEEHAHRRVEALLDVVELNSADRDRRGAVAQDRIDDQIGRDRAEVEQIARELLFDQLLVERGDRDRHVLDILGALVGGDNDVAEAALLGRRLGGVLRACCGRDQRQHESERSGPRRQARANLGFAHRSSPLMRRGLSPRRQDIFISKDFDLARPSYFRYRPL